MALDSAWIDAIEEAGRQDWYEPLRRRSRGDLGELLDQRCNQAQEFLLPWSVTSRNKKGSDLNVGDLATRGKIGLMPDEHPTDIRIAGEQPPIPVGTAVNLSGPNDRDLLHALTPFKLGSARLNEKGGSVTQISGVKRSMRAVQPCRFLAPALRMLPDRNRANAGFVYT